MRNVQVPTTITVEVAGIGRRTYPNATGELGEHLASGGVVTDMTGLREAVLSAHAADSRVVFVEAWVDLHDVPGVVYRMSTSLLGQHRITGAACMGAPVGPRVSFA